MNNTDCTCLGSLSSPHDTHHPLSFFLLLLPPILAQKCAQDSLCHVIGKTLNYTPEDVVLGSFYAQVINGKWRDEIANMEASTAGTVTRAVSALSVNLAAKVLGNRFYSVAGLMEACYGTKLESGFAVRDSDSIVSD